MNDQVKRFLERAREVQATRHGGGAASVAEAQIISLDELRAHREEVADPWGLAALRGRLVELSARGASATLTTATGLVVEAQEASEPVAWITLASASFYPPDVADSGVDLAALVVVRTASAIEAARAAERLLRSGAFGLLVIDLSTSSISSSATAMAEIALPAAVQGRLVTLAQAHDAAILCLTVKSDETASLGSLVSLRAAALRRRDSSGQSEITLQALKDKRRGPGWNRTSKVRGPPGF